MRAKEQKIGNQNQRASASCPISCSSSRRGLSLIELLISLAITAVLLTATMVAIDASFMAYASAAEQASTQTASRLVVHRLLAYIRTGTAHGPLTPDPNADPPVTLDGDTISSNYLELIDPNGKLIRVEYNAEEQTLYGTISDMDGDNATTQPLLTGVTACAFSANRRLDANGVLVLNRATMDLTVVPNADTSTTIERGPGTAVRLIASTMPRKLDD